MRERSKMFRVLLRYPAVGHSYISRVATLLNVNLWRRFHSTLGFMASISCSWTYGKKAWEVSHLGSKGIDHLHLEGDLPSAVSIAQKKCADAIASYVPPPPPPNLPVMPESERLMFERMGLKVMPFGAPTPVDFHFDIPIEVFYKVTGFRHNIVSTACDYNHLRKLAKPGKKS